MKDKVIAVILTLTVVAAVIGNIIFKKKKTPQPKVKKPRHLKLVKKEDR